MIVFSGNKATKPKKSKKKKKAEKQMKINTKMLTSVLPFTSAFIYADEDKMLNKLLDTCVSSPISCSKIIINVIQLDKSHN